MLRSDLLPGLIVNPLPYLQKQALSFAVLTIVTGLAATLRREGWPCRRLLWDSVFVGLGLFVIPLALTTLAAGWVPGLAQASTLFTLTPAFALVFEPYMSPGTATQSRGSLIAALASIAGAFCVFPVGIPTSIQAACGLCAMILATACLAAATGTAVATAKEFSGRSTAVQAAIAAATAAIALAAASAVMERPLWKWDALGPELLWSAMIELPGLLLLFWLLRRMSATRMTTRYVLAPLLAILTGVGLMRIPLAPRTWLGLLLMAAGVAYLLLAPEAESKLEGLSLR